MTLTDDLISQFAKITKDKDQTVKETTVYGTTVEYNGAIYVRLDGSELLTPVISTTNTKADERVTVMIKNHSAIITGNLSSPSARFKDIEDVSDEITELEIAIADKVDTKELVAEIARIDALTADNVIIKDSLTASEAAIEELRADNVVINDTLTAHQAAIEELDVTKLDADVADITYATISDLEATDADIHNLRVTYGEFVEATAQDFKAVYATIENLQVGEFDAVYATIGSLEAERARIDDLEVAVGDIDTLMFGSASGSTIQASFANAVIAQLGNAQIKSAMIENVSADKITSGDIITNNVRVMSEDGKLLISDETIQISDTARVRVQIGKDSAGDYSINIWDADGDLMFSEGGITDSAIKEAIIRNDMVSDTANISAHKLDINSLFEEINGSTNTIKSSQIYLDDQAQRLNVAFEELTTEVSDLDSAVSSQGTQISIMQGQIDSKVWLQDIDNITGDLFTQYTVLEQDLSSFKTSVANIYSTKTDLENLEIGGRNLALKSDTVMRVSNSMAKYELSDYGKTMLVPDQSAVISFDAYADAETTLDCYVRSGSASISSMPVSSIGTDKKRYTVTVVVTSIDPQTVTFRGNTSVPGYVKTNTYISNVKIELGNKATDWTIAPEDSDERLSSMKTSIEQNAKDILLRATKTEVTNLSNNLANNHYTAAETDAKIQVSSEAIESRVQSTYATQLELSSVEQTAAGLLSRVDSQKIGGRNLLPDSEKEVSFTNTVNSFDLTEYGTSVLKNTQAVLSFDLYTNEPGAGCDFYLRYIDSDGSGKAVGITAINNTTDSYVRYYGVINVGDATPTMFAIRTSQHTTGKNQSDTAVFYVRKIKVEIGNMPTDWTPAPEDMATTEALSETRLGLDSTDTRVDRATSLIEQLSNSISQLVTDGSGTSLMTQTESGWTFSTADIRSAINVTSEGLNDLTHELNDANAVISVLQQTVDDLGEIAEYVKIGTYDNEPCIELGEGDSEFKLRITNTRILFMEGSSVIAHFTNQSLHIKKAVIEEELQQGGFVWKVRSNGNMGLVWKGVNN